jgi:hypothetical protein
MVDSAASCPMLNKKMALLALVAVKLATGNFHCNVLRKPFEAEKFDSNELLEASARVELETRDDFKFAMLGASLAEVELEFKKCNAPEPLGAEKLGVETSNFNVLGSMTGDSRNCPTTRNNNKMTTAAFHLPCRKYRCHPFSALSSDDCVGGCCAVISQGVNGCVASRSFSN